MIELVLKSLQLVVPSRLGGDVTCFPDTKKHEQKSERDIVWINMC